MAVAGKAVAGGLRYLLLVLVGALGEGGIEELHHGDVEAVEPEHRLIGLVGMIVPGHRRRDDEIAGLHRGLLAVDGGEGALALEYEAQRRLAVPVGRRDFARHHELDAGVERGRDLGLAAQARVLEDQNPALGFLCGDQLAGLVHVGADRIELPQMRLAGALRLRRDEVVHHVPQRGHILAVDLFVKRLALRGLLHGFHGSLPLC